MSEIVDLKKMDREEAILYLMKTFQLNRKDAEFMYEIEVNDIYNKAKKQGVLID